MMVTQLASGIVTVHFIFEIFHIQNWENCLNGSKH